MVHILRFVVEAEEHIAIAELASGYYLVSLTCR
jgi:hypothetical protein